MGVGAGCSRVHVGTITCAKTSSNASTLFVSDSRITLNQYSLIEPGGAEHLKSILVRCKFYAPVREV